MPGIYNHDYNRPIDSNAAYYSGKSYDNITAFHPSVQIPPGLNEAKTPHDILSKIPPPRNEDHGWGNHTARCNSFPDIRNTPFNNRLKANPSKVSKSGISVKT